MTPTNKTKSDLHKHLIKLLNHRISDAKKAIAAAQESKAAETKSSVGDKYETGRAMIQAEQERHEANMLQNRRLLNELDQLELDQAYDQVVPGSMLYTNQGIYYISIGMGAVKMDNENFFVISLASPIGKVIQGLRKGESVEFKGRNLQILEIL